MPLEILKQVYPKYYKRSQWKYHTVVINSHQTKAVLVSIYNWSIHKENTA